MDENKRQIDEHKGQITDLFRTTDKMKKLRRGVARRDKETSQGKKQREKLAWYCFWETVSIYRLLCGSG
jgi:hypothetical protein